MVISLATQASQEASSLSRLPLYSLWSRVVKVCFVFTPANKEMVSFHVTVSPGRTPCGLWCGAITKCENISACRASWTSQYHPAQTELVSFIKCNLHSITVNIFSDIGLLLAGLCTWPWETLGLNEDTESTVSFEFYTFLARNVLICSNLSQEFRVYIGPLQKGFPWAVCFSGRSCLELMERIGRSV